MAHLARIITSPIDCPMRVLPESRRGPAEMNGVQVVEGQNVHSLP